MPENKYKLNLETLEYELVTLTRKQKINRTLIALSIFVSVGLVFRYGYGEWYVSYKEDKLQAEQVHLQKKIMALNTEVEHSSNKLQDIQMKDDISYRPFLSQKPIPQSVREAGVGGTEKYSHLLGYKNSPLLVETQQKIDKLSRQLYIQSKSFDDVTEKALLNDKEYSSKPLVQPMNRKDYVRISDKYGYRIHPTLKYRKFHDGVDYAGPIGKPIYSTGDGKVTRAGVLGGYGKMVEVDHGFGFKTRYAHLSQIKVRKGERISRGTIVGELGNTGRSTGPHLHYEVIKNGKAVNPLDMYIPIGVNEFDKMIANSSAK